MTEPNHNYNSVSSGSFVINTNDPAATPITAPLMLSGVSSPKTECAICGNPATGTTFGFDSCNPCKKFFQRHRFDKISEIRCELGGRFNCDLSKRRPCTKCRLLRCLRLSKQTSKEFLRDADRNFMMVEKHRTVMNRLRSFISDRGNPNESRDNNQSPLSPVSYSQSDETEMSVSGKSDLKPCRNGDDDDVDDEIDVEDHPHHLSNTRLNNASVINNVNNNNNNNNSSSSNKIMLPSSSSLMNEIAVVMPRLPATSTSASTSGESPLSISAATSAFVVPHSTSDRTAALMNPLLSNPTATLRDFVTRSADSIAHSYSSFCKAFSDLVEQFSETERSNLVQNGFYLKPFCSPSLCDLAMAFQLYFAVLLYPESNVSRDLVMATQQQNPTFAELAFLPSLQLCQNGPEERRNFDPVSYIPILVNLHNIRKTLVAFAPSNSNQ